MLDWLLKKIDINKDGKADVDQVKAAVDKLLLSSKDALDKLDYKTIIVHLNDILEAIQAIATYAEQIRKAIDTPQAKQAAEDLKQAVSAFNDLIKSFANASKK